MNHVTVTEREDGLVWVECRCGWYDGGFRLETDAVKAGLDHQRLQE